MKSPIEQQYQKDRVKHVIHARIMVVIMVAVGAVFAFNSLSELNALFGV